MAGVAAAVARTNAENNALMRSWRMNQIPDLCDGAAYPALMCPKFAAARQREMFQSFKHLILGLVPGREQKLVPVLNGAGFG
jgi:hypothetical protein